MKHQDQRTESGINSRDTIYAMSAVILPLLKRRQEVQLDLQENKEMNNLSLVHKFDEVSAINCQLLDDKKKLFTNKLLLLSFLRVHLQHQLG